MSICPICESSFVDSGKFKPRIYCCDNCKNYAKYKNALESTINKLDIKTAKAKKIVRGDMFRLANILSKCTVSNSIRGVV